MITLKIITPMESVTVENVSKVSLPGAAGPFVVLPGHAALVSTLTAGEVRYSAADGGHSRPVVRGAVKVEADTVTVCIER